MSLSEFTESDIPAATEGDEFRYEPVGPGHRNFQPWHQPRKQFVRCEQWAAVIENHLAVSPVVGRPLKYIGLPGDDLLDIRYFVERICNANNLPFFYLGLNENIDSMSSSRTRVDSAIFDIRTKFPLVCESSEVVSDSFLNLSEPKSLVFKKCDDIGFFDVVNLDLCDGLAKNKPGAIEPNNYNAIQHLLGRQLKSRSSWLLFLTTRVGPVHCEKGTKAKLEALVDSNKEKCDGFALAIDQLCDGSMDTATAHVRVMAINMVGLLKWLGHMCIAESGWIMEIQVIDCYTVRTKSPVEDLFSVAVRFSPKEAVVADPVGLGTAKPVTDDECRIAMEVVARLSERRNVDALLKENRPTYKKAVEEQGALLKAAGYDLEAYADHLCSVWKLPPIVIGVAG